MEQTGKNPLGEAEQRPLMPILEDLLSIARISAVMLAHEAKLYQERQEPKKAAPVKGQALILEAAVAEVEAWIARPVGPETPPVEYTFEDTALAHQLERIAQAAEQIASGGLGFGPGKPRH
jgi:hypothetical protein